MVGKQSMIHLHPIASGKLTELAIENGHFYLIYSLEIVTFHSDMSFTRGDLRGILDMGWHSSFQRMFLAMQKDVSTPAARREKYTVDVFLYE